MHWTATIVYFICFSTMAYSNDDDWEINKNVVDLGIGIHYGDGTEANNTALIPLLDKLVKALNASKETTRIAIIEFRGGPQIRLAINEGISEDSVFQGLQLIKKRNETLTTDKNWTTTEAAIFVNEHLKTTGSDRADVPKLVFLFRAGEAVDMALRPRRVENKTQFVNENYVTPIVEHPGLESVSAVFMDRFWDNQGDPYVLMVTYGYESGDDSVVQTPWSNAKSKNGSEMVKRAIQWNLGLCRFKKSIKCRGDCLVADVTYDFAYQPPNSSRVEPNRWQRVKHYCFKNSTTECVDPQCGSPPVEQSTGSIDPGDRSTHSAKESSESNGGPSDDPTKPGLVDDDSAAESIDDPKIAALKHTLTGLGIAIGFFLLLNACLLVWLCQEKKAAAADGKALKQKAEESRSSTSDLSKSKSKSSEWSVVAPPEVTTTPHEELVQNYAKKSDNSTKSMAKSMATKSISTKSMATRSATTSTSFVKTSFLERPMRNANRK